MARVRLDPGLNDHVEGMAGVTIGLSIEAGEIAKIARSIAPVDQGGYRDGIEAAIEHGNVRVIAKDFKSHWIEFGAREGMDVPAFPAHATLRLAAGSRGHRTRSDFSG